jgi:hypothetical protein
MVVELWSCGEGHGSVSGWPGRIHFVRAAAECIDGVCMAMGSTACYPGTVKTLMTLWTLIPSVPAPRSALRVEVPGVFGAYMLLVVPKVPGAMH